MASAYIIPGLPPESRPFFISDKQKAISIIEIVCTYKGMEVANVVKKGRKRVNVYARKLAMYFMRDRTILIFEDIGSFFNAHDHSTVIHALESLKDLADTDESIREDIYNLEKLITYAKREKKRVFPVRPAKG